MQFVWEDFVVFSLYFDRIKVTLGYFYLFMSSCSVYTASFILDFISLEGNLREKFSVKRPKNKVPWLFSFGSLCFSFCSYLSQIVEPIFVIIFLF